ncbi:MAG: cyclodeaminase/cyclohydrolase family protein [Chloroflexota bacterium]|nr:cyclodeaminase/cyclohydrolase family protein [Chloroflexota bacterium]
MDQRLSELSVRTFVEHLATSDPIPGGGSAAAMAGAMAAALIHMVVELTIGRPAADGNEDVLMLTRRAAVASQSELVNLAELDANAYGAVILARKLPRETDRERDARAIQVAACLREATRVPVATARAASGVLELAQRVAPIGNRNAVSDVGVAALLAVAALRGAALNVQINLPHLSADEPLRAEAAAEIEGLLSTVDARDRTIRNAVAERLR